MTNFVSERVVRVRDHSTLVRDSGGSGDAIILIHALSMNCHFWSLGGVFDRLAASRTKQGKARRVIAYDLRGHGHAQDAPLTQSLSQLAEDLKTLLQTLELSKVHLMGVSFGGAVAQTFAINYPDLSHSATFIATTSTGSPIIANRATLAETKGMDAMIDESIPRWFLPKTIAEDAEAVRFARNCVSKTRIENWAAAWRAMAGIDCLAQLGKIETPVLVLAGKEDTSTPPAVMRKMCDACRLGEHREIESGMHFFVVESPEATSAELIAFLNRVDETRG